MLIIFFSIKKSPTHMPPAPTNADADADADADCGCRYALRADWLVNWTKRTISYNHIFGRGKSKKKI